MLLEAASCEGACLDEVVLWVNQKLSTFSQFLPYLIFHLQLDLLHLARKGILYFLLPGEQLRGMGFFILQAID